jgi:glycine oxidase
MACAEWAVNRTSAIDFYNCGMASSPDVLVIGGGIIGLTSAYFLAKAGLAVEVRDRADLGREASWAGAGIIPPGLFPQLTTNPLDHLRAASVVRFSNVSAELREESEIDNEFHYCGGIEFLEEVDRDLTDLWRQERIPFEPLTVKLRQVVGDVSHPEGTIAYWLPMMAQVRNPRHLAALVEACRRRGVRLRPHTRTDDWRRIPAGRRLIAAGAWADELLAPLGCRLGVRPVRGQIVLFNPGRVILRHVLIVGKRYLVPRRDGRILAGATEEPEAGFEKANTPEGVQGLIDFARELVPELRNAAIETTWAGLRPGSPDGMPFIGSVPGCDNIFAAVGHFRAGIQLSIGTAEMVRDLILGQPPSIPADAFRLDRTPNMTIRPAFRS